MTENGRIEMQPEGLIIAAQDQAIKTKYLQTKIRKDDSNSNCRLSDRFQETVDHNISGCSELAKTEYLDRNKVAAYVHRNICKNYNIEVCRKMVRTQPRDSYQ